MGAPRILHYPGSKWSMTDWLLSFVPDHDEYLEPFFGSGAVLFNKPPSKVETVGDKNERITNLFRVIRHRKEELAEQIFFTPYSRAEYELSFSKSDDELEDARRTLIRCWMARGGKTVHRTGWRHIIDSSGPSVAKQWNNLPDIIMQTAERLKNVQIETQDALTLLERYRRPSVFIYADPPYLRSTRTTTIYETEMSDDEHITLLEMLDEHPGPVLISGYSSEMYDMRLKHWRRETKQVQAEGGVPRDEVLWINPVAAKQIGQMSLF